MDTSGQPNIAIFAHEAGSVGTTVASISTWVATTTTRGNLGWSGEAWEGVRVLVRAGEGWARPAPGWKTGHFQQFGDVTCKKVVEGTQDQGLGRGLTSELGVEGHPKEQDREIERGPFENSAS